MGFKNDEHMKVIWLRPEGQAAGKGVQLGWKVIAVNGVVVGDNAELDLQLEQVGARTDPH